MTPFVYHIAAITVLDVVGSLCAKYWSVSKSPWLLAATFLTFGAAGVVFAYSLKYESMAITNVLWISVSIILITIIGYFLFKEAITPVQFVGIAVIIVGLVLINMK
ncbi:EamA family transporter [Patescibacteria group bacterium]|nr:EamA family transporter [Patescibacteria group bacterium]